MLNYGIVGNCKTCALIDKKASISWLCFPTFDSPSIFAKILDKKKGGSFDIITKDKYKTRQKYIENTNILETYFESKKNSFKVIDFMPRYRKLLPNRRTKLFKQHRLIRIIKPIKGNPEIKINYNPKLNYSQGKSITKFIENNLITKNSNKQTISLISNIDHLKILTKEYFELNRTKYFVIGKPDKATDFSVAHCLRLKGWTQKYWRRWVSTLTLPDKKKEQIIRSALTLKLLTFSETGAIIAAATTSIPEEIGTERNWDYRYCWIRDAAFTVDALKRIGRNYEAKKLMQFIFENTIKKKKRMQIMYGIDDRSDLAEKKLEHLEGFKGSKPVRIGNAAYLQKQNDIYGSVIDILYLYYAYYEYEHKMQHKYWKFLKHLVQEIKDHWKEKDHGIWEFRGEKKHHTYSKLMCWVGLDSAIKLATHYEKHKIAEKWCSLRDKIKQDILKNAWSSKKRAFAMFYGGNALDAALLRMADYEFLPKDDPRLILTIKRINKELRKGCFVQRYKSKDDFGKPKSAFAICSFWLVEALFYIGELKEAQQLLNKLMRYSNHLGLFSEDIDLKTKKQTGNFPQAYTHIASINASILLSEWNVKRKKIDLSNIKKVR